MQIMKTHTSIGFGLVCVLAAAGLCTATVAHAGDPAKGQRIVEKWCSQCHAQTGSENNPERGPTYEQIASLDGRDERYIRAFLDRDHFPMTTYRLFDHEKDDVAAFIASLARR